MVDYQILMIVKDISYQILQKFYSSIIQMQLKKSNVLKQYL